MVLGIFSRASVQNGEAAVVENWGIGGSLGGCPAREFHRDSTFVKLKIQAEQCDGLVTEGGTLVKAVQAV